MRDRLTGIALLDARLPPAVARADACTAALTQAAMQRCADDEFLAARADYARAYRALTATLAAPARTRLRTMRQAWIRYRSATREFERGAVEGGSAEPLVSSQWMTRLTHSPTTGLAQRADCPEGDVRCVARRPATR